MFAEDAKAINERLDAHDKQLTVLSAEVATNTQLTREVKTDTADLVAIMHNAKVGAQLIVSLVKIAKFLGTAIVAVLSFWLLVQAIWHGQLPKFPFFTDTHL